MQSALRHGVALEFLRPSRKNGAAERLEAMRLLVGHGRAERVGFVNSVVTDLQGIDVYRIMLYPLALGSGKRFFRDGRVGKTTLTLSDTKTTSTGVVVLTYEATETDAEGKDAKEQD
jgi:hypothetical protein